MEKRDFAVKNQLMSNGWKRGDCPNAEYISDRTVSLPLSAKLTEEDVDDVIKAVQKVIEHFRR